MGTLLGLFALGLTACSSEAGDGSAKGAGAAVGLGGAGQGGGTGGTEGGLGGDGGNLAGGGGVSGTGGLDGSSVCTPGDSESCYEGAPGTDGVGLCARGSHQCKTDGSGFGACQGQTLPVAETCSTAGDDDCDGLANEEGADCSCVPDSIADCYSAPPATKGVGPCVGGKQTCNSAGLGYGPCQGEVVPKPETCTTAEDDDCDGKVNEEGAGCACVPNATAACYSGPAGTQNVGACKAGLKTCNAQGTEYGACNGQVLPVAEICTNTGDDDCNGKLNDGCTYQSCLQIKQYNPAATSGTYSIDTDGSGPKPALQVHCDMVTDGGGYTMVRIANAALGTTQEPYAAQCATYGLEIIVTRSKPHAQAVYTWNGGEPANIVNVFPKSNGATGIFNWQGMCKGAPCTFWMTDDPNGDVGCANFEPNGDNSTSYRIYRRDAGCGIQGNWNDAYDVVQLTGWVVCSTNDK